MFIFWGVGPDFAVVQMSRGRTGSETPRQTELACPQQLDQGFCYVEAANLNPAARSHDLKTRTEPPIEQA